MFDFLHLKRLRKPPFILVVLTVLACISCSTKKELQLSGKTMGTTYHIKVVAGLFTGDKKLQQKIDERLSAINKSMSTYDPNSEISQFNAIVSAAEDFTPSDDFLTVLRVAEKIHTLTEGAWDGTLDPLITLWGFGRKGSTRKIPEQTDIDKALSQVGFGRIRFNSAGSIGKKAPSVTLDLASIAKGYGVDEIARLLGKMGFTDFLVEIGGEVFARGHRKDGKPWRVGINNPDRNAAFNDVYRAIPLTNRAMATSGDYRIFYQIGDKTYSHILDPRTGRPVQNGVVSATVVAANCTVADGIATALMVMGPEKGVALVDRLPSVECLIIVRNQDDTFTEHPSQGFILN